MNKNELIKIVSKIKEEELNDLYEWLNSFTLSRKIKNVHRDFSDGVLMAELVNICLPKFVELHNYSKAHSINQKKYNWNTLNEKVFKRLGFKIDKKSLDEIVNCKYMGVEKVLHTFKNQLNKFQNELKEEENLHISNGEKEKTVNEKENLLCNQENDVHNEMNSGSFNNDEIIKILKDKIFNLEKLLKIKVRKKGTLHIKMKKKIYIYNKYNR